MAQALRSWVHSRPELAPFSSSQTSEMGSVVERRGSRGGPIPSHQQNLGRNRAQARQGHKPQSLSARLTRRSPTAS